ncbi:hypothetical protein Tco_1061774, partial [Tanacetum coccineum]
MVINSPCLIDKKELAIPGQTTTGKEFSNPLMANSLSKTIPPTKFTATVETVNDGEQQIIVTVDEQTISITKASVRRHLQLAVVDGISSLPNTEIFEQLTLMGYVYNGDKLTFQKGGDTPGSDEGSKKLNELTKLCTKLSKKVTSLKDDLKQTKKVYGKALTKLVKRVKHLEAKLKSTSVRRKARMTEYEEVEYELDQTDTFQQITPTKVSQGEEHSLESFEVQLDVLSAAKILADASRERERIDFEKALELQKQLDEREETDNIYWSIVAKQVQERQSDTIKRYQTLTKKPVSVAQVRKNMMIYLKNMTGYKMGYFKGMSYDEIRPMFKKEYNKIQILFKKDTEVEKTKTKRVAEETLLQESFKKL